MNIELVLFYFNEIFNPFKNKIFSLIYDLEGEKNFKLEKIPQGLKNLEIYLEDFIPPQDKILDYRMIIGHLEFFHFEL